MPDWLKEWWPVFALAIGVVVPLITTWINWSIKHRFASKDDLAAETMARSQAIDGERKSRHEREGELRGLVDQSARRIDKIELSMAHMPSAEAVSALSLQMTRVEGRLAVFDERVDGIDALMTRMDRQVQVMDDFLRKVRAA